MYNHSHTADRSATGKRVALVGALVNCIMAGTKLVIGSLANSQALIADGVHSLSDLSTDLLVYFTAKHAHDEPDEEHPYGHGRIETLATIALGLLLLLVGAGIIYEASSRLFEADTLLVPGQLALWGAAISIVANEGLYQYTIIAANRVNSSLLRANAWHHRADAASSIIVLLGVGGSMLGWVYLDAIAAVLVGGMICRIGWGQVWESGLELIDTGLEPERVEAIRQAILSVDGVQAMHLLRTRRMAGQALVDVHIQVDSYLTVSEGHMISETVRARIIRQIDEVADVMVHIDPEDDETVASCMNLPLRGQVIEDLQGCWSGADLGHEAVRVSLHYLDGMIEVVLMDGVGLGVDAKRLERDCQGLGYVRSVTVCTV